ncbi:MAG: acyltransferase [Oscillospiraceae bacterium]|jgi:hypothetical protein|nr:acyltransferase [Oscillospiraceae bacterium]
MANAAPPRQLAGKAEHIYLFDNLKAIMIYCVVIAHLHSFTDELAFMNAHPYHAAFSLMVRYTIYPVFMLVSGYLSRSTIADDRRFFRREANLLFLNVFFFFIVDLLIFGGTDTSVYLFLSSLMVGTLALRMSRDFKFPYVLAVFVLIFLGASLIMNRLTIYYQPIALVPYFIIGYHFPDAFFRKRRPLWQQLTAFVLLVGGNLVMAFLPNEVRIAQLTMSALPAHNVFLRPPLVLLEMVIASAFTLLLLFAVPRCKIPFISNIGKNSLGIFLLHWPLMQIWNHVSPNTLDAIVHYEVPYLPGCTVMLLSAVLTILLSFGIVQKPFVWLLPITNKIGDWMLLLFERAKAETIPGGSKQTKKQAANPSAAQAPSKKR